MHLHPGGRRRTGQKAAATKSKRKGIAKPYVEIFARTL